MSVRQPADSKATTTTIEENIQRIDTEISRTQKELMETLAHGDLQPRRRCPHCHKKGNVRVKVVSSSGQIHTKATCMNCKETWQI